jgi:hypothetical protein
MTTFDPLSGLAIAIYMLIGLAFAVLLIPLVLARRTHSIEAFFGIPFITWYLLLYTVATIGILSIVILGLVGVLNATAIAALLGGLFGYVLGAASRPHDAPTTTGVAAATPSPSVQQGDRTESVPVDEDPS